jgi:hypothetical protein
MVELRTHEVLLAVVVRLEVLEWRRSTVSFSRIVTTTEEVVLVSVVVVDLSSNFIRRRKCGPSTRMAMEGDGGGQRQQVEVGGSGEQSRAEQSSACVRRKGNGIGSPLATSMHGDKVSTHMGRWRQPAVAGVAALTWRWHGDQAVAHAHGYG